MRVSLRRRLSFCLSGHEAEILFHGDWEKQRAFLSEDPFCFTFDWKTSRNSGSLWREGIRTLIAGSTIRNADHCTTDHMTGEGAQRQMQVLFLSVERPDGNYDDSYNPKEKPPRKPSVISLVPIH